MMEKIGPYRVEEQIGVGGMGEVYKAYDDRLDRWVAIKRIRDDKEQGSENRERFQREAKATAKLNHSAIVHLYDIFRDGESDCIVMEFVEGVTLDKLIRNGPLEAVQVASLGHEIASGLAEAHAKGIIHRDLKVENVIVTPEGHAKILDFGLARPLLSNDLDPSLTGKGQLVGTSRAMSPEYVGGEDIDHRSDLFSLGVLLYESVTSHSPFKAHNTLATLKQVMLHRQTPAHVVNASVPEDFSAVIENLLEKDPEDRPQNAREVARELGQISGNLSSGDVDRPSLTGMFTATPTEVIAPTTTSVEMWSLRRWLVIAAVLVAGVAATYFLTRWWLTDSENLPVHGATSDPVARKKDRIVLADFQNLTGEPLLDNSIATPFRLGLEQSRHAYVLPRSQIQGALSRMERDVDTPVDREVGIEIGEREGAQALVVGGISKIGGTYAVTAEVVDPQSGVTTFSVQESAGSQDAIIQVLGTVTASIRVHLGESRVAVEQSRRPLEKVTTANLEALKAYSLGQARIDKGRSEDAIQLLERAIELDPEFAMAHAKLGAVHMVLDRDRSTTLEHFDQALRLSDRLTEIEKLYVDGWSARLLGNPEAVVRAFSLMSTLYPNEFAGHHNLGMAQGTYYGRYQDAARAFQAAAGVAPPENRSSALTSLAYCQIALGLYDQAQRTLEQASGLYKDLAQADLYLATESYSKARSEIDRSVTAPSRRQQLLGKFQLVELHANRGNLDEAQQEALEAARLAGEEGAGLNSMAAQLAVIAVQEHIGPEEALTSSLTSATRAAIDLLGTYPERSSDAPISRLALLGKLNARNMHLDNAKWIYSAVAAAAKDTSLALWKSHAMLLEGELLAAQRRHGEALARFNAAAAITDSFQIRESLARAYEASGQIDEAIAEYEWILEHRGRGLVECYAECPALSAFDWALALDHLGRLYEQRGDRDAAIEYTSRFLDLWSEGDELDVVKDAKRRLVALQEP